MKILRKLKRGIKLESNKKNHCTQWQCPIHACMSKECQIEYVKESGPHVIAEFASVILKYCPHQDVLSSVLCELKRAPDMHILPKL